MRFLCRRCESFMSFQGVEAVGPDSLGVAYRCPDCGAGIAMVTNPGETQMVKALGVDLGGRKAAPEPLELTRRTLAAGAPRAEPGAPPAPALPAESKGKCPFANALASMPQASAAAPEQAPVAWSERARERLEKVPEFVRSFAKSMIEDMARQRGLARVDEALMDAAKERFM